MVMDPFPGQTPEQAANWERIKSQPPPHGIAMHVPLRADPREEALRRSMEVCDRRRRFADGLILGGAVLAALDLVGLLMLWSTFGRLLK